MPRLSDIPGKGRLGRTSRRGKVLVAGAGLGALALGGVVIRKALGRGGGDGGAVSADPIAETRTAPPGRRTMPVPRPEHEADDPVGGDPGAAPAKTTGTDAPPAPASEPGNISADREPHHALNNPVGDPDETEYPDSFEKRDDPRDPPDPDGAPFGEEPHPQTGSESTSEPPSSQDLEAGDRAEPPRRDKLDD